MAEVEGDLLPVAPMIERAVWSRPPQSGDKLVILLHGLGGDEAEMLPLSAALPPQLVYVALRGIYPYEAGWSWLDNPINPDQPQKLQHSAAAVENWIAEHEHQILGLIGFSQGAIVALEILRNQPESFEFVAQLSGGPFPQPNAGDARLRELRPKVFWGHGNQDPTLPPELETYVRQWLRAHTTLTEWEAPGLGHDVNEAELAELSRFISGADEWLR